MPIGIGISGSLMQLSGPPGMIFIWGYWWTTRWARGESSVAASTRRASTSSRRFAPVTGITILSTLAFLYLATKACSVPVPFHTAVVTVGWSRSSGVLTLLLSLRTA